MPSQKLQDAIVDPHDARERFDPEFILLCRCGTCGEEWMAPRKLIQDSTRDHLESCPEKALAVDRGTASVRVFYPRQ